MRCTHCWSLLDDGDDDGEMGHVQDVDLTDIEGVSGERAAALRDRGLLSVGDVARASDEVLTSIDGVGKATAMRIRASAREILEA
jgi:ERCC4-type nuclease